MDEAIPAVRRLKEGKAVDASTEFLMRKFRPRLLAYFRHHNFTEADAEDLVQETFRRVITGIRGLNDEEKFMPWFFRIARNVRLTARAAAIQKPEEPMDNLEVVEPADPSENPISRTIHRQQLERTWEAVERLPAQQKQCLVLRAAHEMSYEEIAVVLRLSVSTVRNHLREARLSLRRMVGDFVVKGGPDGSV